MESHWNYKAHNKGGAYGIAQALPASKMRVSGHDYLTNPYTQIRWGLRYIKTRYSNRACWALRSELVKGWY
jgi:soluble lytic murein transglycosylase-like protein